MFLSIISIKGFMNRSSYINELKDYGDTKTKKTLGI